MHDDHPTDPAHLTYAVHNLEVWARALVVLQEFAAQNIPVIVLKSLPQIEDLYGDVGGRATGDVDLVVSSEQASAAIAAITGLGWTLNDRRLYEILESASNTGNFAGSRPWHFTRFTHGRPCLIDLHFDAMNPWMFPTLDRAIWHRAVPRQSDGVDFMVLGPEDRLLFLCRHFFSDSWSDAIAWRSLADIELALQPEQEIDWQYLARRARETGTIIFLYLACDLVASRAELPVAPHWRSTLALPAPRRYAFLWFLLVRYFERMHTRRRLVFFLLAHDRLRSVLPLWRHIFFPSRVTIGADYLDAWPSWPTYARTLVKIYAHRLQKTFRPEQLP